MWSFNTVWSNFPISSGVYAIVNILNGKKYVGSTKCFKERFAEHRSQLRSGKHKNIHLQNAFNKYGERYFKFVILEECENIQDTLNFIEQKWIDSDGDYNICPVANRRTYTKMPEWLKEKLRKINTGRVCTEEVRKKLSEALKGHKPSQQQLENQSKGRKGKGTKAVDQYNLSGKYIRTFSSLTEASKAINGSYVSINKCCKGKLHSAYGFLWKYNKDCRNIFDIVRPLNNTRNKRAVYQIDAHTDHIICEFPSIKDAAIAMGSLANRSAINRCCLGSKRTAFGFRWKYKYN